jgi:hypothetical protein
VAAVEGTSVPSNDFYSTWSPYNMPRMHNLEWDPREEHPVDFPHAWVAYPMAAAAEAFLKSLVIEPPIKTGTPDPYQIFAAPSMTERTGAWMSLPSAVVSGLRSASPAGPCFGCRPAGRWGRSAVAAVRVPFRRVDLHRVRNHVLRVLDGLSDDQLGRPVLPSGRSCLGILRHLALSGEYYRFRRVAAASQADVTLAAPWADLSTGPRPGTWPAASMGWRLRRSSRAGLGHRTPLTQPARSNSRINPADRST